MTAELPLLDPEQPAKATGPVSVFELLRKRYPSPAWAFLEEVRNGTGYGRTTRTADALAMSLWPSRGLHLHGFEVKVSRADWVRERDDPAKAEEIAKFCHFWHLVIDDPKIVQNGEVPATWGLLVSDGRKLICEREATFNKEALAPTYKFLGAILRKVCSTSTDEVRLARARQEGHDEGWREGVAHGEGFSEEGRYKKLFEQERDAIRKFETTTGINVRYHKLSMIGNAVRLLTGDWDSPINGMERLSKNAHDIAAKCDEALAELRKVIPAAKDEDPP